MLMIDTYKLKNPKNKKTLTLRALITIFVLTLLILGLGIFIFFTSNCLPRPYSSFKEVTGHYKRYSQWHGKGSSPELCFEDDKKFRFKSFVDDKFKKESFLMDVSPGTEITVLAYHWGGNDYDIAGIRLDNTIYLSYDDYYQAQVYNNKIGKFVGIGLIILSTGVIIFIVIFSIKKLCLKLK
jgi:hypothetical protein